MSALTYGLTNEQIADGAHLSMNTERSLDVRVDALDHRRRLPD
jgi:hypothetical protein